MVRNWEALNSNSWGMNLATATTTATPSSENLIDFSLFPKEIHQIVLHYLPMATICNLLATCGALQLRYLLLFNEEFKALPDDVTPPADQHTKFLGSMAKERFNRNPHSRSTHYLLAGPNGEPLYEQYHGVYANPSIIARLRTGALPISVSELRDRQQRWLVLRDQLVQHRAHRGRGMLPLPMPEIINWLGCQIMTVSSELSTMLTKCILDESLPLTTEKIGMESPRGGTISPIGFKYFQDMLDIPCIAVALDNEEVHISELFKMGYYYENGNGLVKLSRDPRVNAALHSGNVTLNQLSELLEWKEYGAEYGEKYTSNGKFDTFRVLRWEDNALRRIRYPQYILQIFERSLNNEVIKVLLDTDELTLTTLIELAQAEICMFVLDNDQCSYFELMLDIFDLQAIQHYFISDASFFKQLMTLHARDYAFAEKGIYLYTIFSALKRILKNPIIQAHLTDAEEGKQYLQHILNLACQEKNWEQHIKDQFHQELRTSQFFLCPGLLKLHKALTTQVIHDYVVTKNRSDAATSKLNLSQLIDLIMDEAKDPSDQFVLWYLAEGKPPSLDEKNCSPFLHPIAEKEDHTDLPQFRPFEYAKFTLALMHPEVKQQVDAGTLSLQELAKKLKGDPLSGCCVALFGFSGQHNAEYKKRIEQNFWNAPREGVVFWVLMRLGQLTIEQFITIIREDRQVTVNSLAKTFWGIISDLSPLIESDVVSVKELMCATDEVIAQLYSPNIRQIIGRKQISLDDRLTVRAIVEASRLSG
jgi:hypothetical protein